ncbi:MAG: DUF58 domain-containing protein [Bacteroidetes bacterium]|nr:DUF58 domain-containing protein [Bacteroidota bacterium]
MDTKELLQKVRQIEIKTRGLSAQLFSGEYHSAFKGKGMTFSEVRDYSHGDDIRNIDWNVTARFSAPFVKVFEEERELCVMLLIDVSASGSFGSTTQTKKDFITEIAAVLAFSSALNNDKIGVVLFSDKVEKFIPPKKGKKHVLRIIRDLIEFSPENKGTDIAAGLRYLSNVIKKKSTVFLISDFIGNNFSDAVKIANKKHDIIGMRIFDQKEKELPSVGLVKLFDNESGKEIWINTSSSKTKDAHKKWWLKHEAELNAIFTKSGIDYVSLDIDKPYVRPLMGLFKKRGA